MEKTLVKYSRYFFVSLLFLIAGAFVVFQCSMFFGDKPIKILASNEVLEPKKVTISAENSEVEAVEMQSEVLGGDARPILVEKYLEKYKSPLLPYADKIVELSELYGFDYYWIVAIAQQESNLCKKIPEDSHNCWGYGIHSQGTLKFENYNLALESFAAYLKKQYFDKGLNTPELIMGKYCPHSDGSWARGVQQFIDELESGKKLN